MSESLQGLSAYLRAQAVALDAIPRQAFGGEAPRSAKTLRAWADEVDELVGQQPRAEVYGVDVFEQPWPTPPRVSHVITDAGRKLMDAEAARALEPSPFTSAMEQGGSACVFSTEPHPTVVKIVEQFGEALHRLTGTPAGQPEGSAQ